MKRGASTSRDPATAAAELHAAIAQTDTALAIFYVASDFDLPTLARELRERFGDTPLIGCTTAGEITPIGYLQGAIVGVSVASSDLHVVVRCIDDLENFKVSTGESVGRGLLADLERVRPTASGADTFGFLLIDGLSNQEESVVSALARSLGDIQLFGGSAGDGTRFGKTAIYVDGAFRSNAAVFSLVSTSHPFHVFKTQHFEASDEKMVVTEADPSRRLVTEINGVPAGREYARAVGLDVDKLTPMIFATYPVVVKVGGDYYVRSIQKVNPDESLSFFCAIDAGIVLTVARGVDLLDNLRRCFSQVREKIGPPMLVLGCDCILRNLELEQRGLREECWKIFAENNVIGFATYGEQFNSMHVNQTFTGVAIGGLTSQ